MSEKPVDEARFGKILAGINYQPRPAAYAVITNGDRRVAAVRGKRGFFLPGGGSLPGEQPEETIRREVLEELARTVRLLRKIGEATQYFSAGEEHYRMRAVFYAAEFTGEHESEAEYTLAWLSLPEIEERFFHECHVWAVHLACSSAVGQFEK
ncbi:MAG TPA: NUDIX domain-containing protein [Pyrinomonadaceae bacterium]|jgi:8-oxo-dGTP diphosphatase